MPLLPTRLLHNSTNTEPTETNRKTSSNVSHITFKPSQADFQRSDSLYKFTPVDKFICILEVTQKQALKNANSSANAEYPTTKMYSSVSESCVMGLLLCSSDALVTASGENRRSAAEQLFEFKLQNLQANRKFFSVLRGTAK